MIVHIAGSERSRDLWNIFKEQFRCVGPTAFRELFTLFQQTTGDFCIDA